MPEDIYVPGTSSTPSHSQATAGGGFIFVAGLLGMDPVTEVMAEGAQAQAAQAIESMAQILEVAGASLADLVKTTVLLARREDGAAVAAVYNQLIPEPRPARTMYTVAGLPRGALVVIDGIAVAPATRSA